MKENQEKAWSILSQNERYSLLLQTSHGQSSWEAGEIMGISHYKYLELRERAIKFFKMFSEYFSNHECLVLPNCPVDPRFRDFVEACIEKRMDKGDAVRYSGDSSLQVSEINNKFIQKNMLRLKESENILDNQLYSLILEFDRWNNKRVLPRCLQLPSAYKRRNNNRDKTYLRYLANLPSYKIDALIDIFKYKFRKKNAKKWYICLISSDYPDGYTIIPVKPSNHNLEKLSNLSIFIFESEDNADVFGYMVTRFLENQNHTQSSGQKFWKEYREHIQRSINYTRVNNHEFYAEKLDMAYEIPKGGRKVLKKKKQKNTTKRADPKLFYL